MSVDLDSVTLAVLGGTGPQGRGLARRFALSGMAVVIGSRDAERGASVAAGLGLPGLRGAGNAEAARAGALAIVAVPYAGHADLLRGLVDELSGKVVVDCVNPLGFDGQGAYRLPVPEGSAAEQAAAVLGDSSVVGAFHHVSAVHLEDEDAAGVDTDVLVVGDDRDATDTVVALAGRVPGMRGVYAGRLRNAGQVEALTANLIAVNRRYKAHAGLRITDV